MHRPRCARRLSARDLTHPLRAVPLTSPNPLPAGVVAFLDEYIFTVSQLEVLLLVHEARGAVRTAEDLSRESYLPTHSITPWLDALVKQGVLDAAEGGYRFAPADDGMRRALDEVAECYARRRVSVTRHVYASKEDPVARFADAFRFRKDKDR